MIHNYQFTIRNYREIRAIREIRGCNIVWDTSKPDGQPRRCLDTSKAEKFFGFRAQTPFEDGLRETIAWYEQTQSEKVLV